MKVCLDEGRLQSFFDGELPAEMMEQAARHIAACEKCAQAVRAVETENALYLEALTPEMSMSVPTEQLRARITEAIAVSGSPAAPGVRETTNRSPFSSLLDLFWLRPQRAAAFAAVLAIVLLGSIFAAMKLRSSRPAEPIAQTTPPDQIAETTVKTPPAPPVEAGPGPRRSNHRPLSPADQVTRVKLIPGEENYLRTIATLDTDLKQGGPQTMTPTNRAEYERNLKLVDNAIAATRSKAKRAPHDPDAAEFMFAAYQSKIDLLNSFSETSRLQR